VVRIAGKNAEIGGQEDGRGRIFGISDHQSRANKTISKGSDGTRTPEGGGGGIAYRSSTAVGVRVSTHGLGHSARKCDTLIREHV